MTLVSADEPQILYVFEGKMHGDCPYPFGVLTESPEFG
jgi:hypothetical protein